MAYTTNHLRLVVSGSLYQTDIFSYGINFAPATSPTPAPPSDVPPAVLDAVESFHTTTSLISQYARLQTVKLNLIGQDGKYVEDDTVFHDYDPYVAGSSSSKPAPQISLAITTETAARRGRAHAGRFYLPLPGSAPDTDGRLSAADALFYAQAAGGFLDDLNDALPGWQAAVMSDLGVTRPITGVRCGRVLDTIRSRRNAFVEDYATFPLS